MNKQKIIDRCRILIIREIKSILKQAGGSITNLLVALPIDTGYYDKYSIEYVIGISAQKDNILLVCRDNNGEEALNDINLFSLDELVKILMAL